MLVKNTVSGDMPIPLPGLPAFICPERTSIAKVDNLLYFRSADEVGRTNLWKSNGTTAGTVMVKVVDANDYLPRNLVSYNGKLYFEINQKLWRSDGTPIGTIPVENTDLADQSSPCWLTVMNNRLFFSARGNTVGEELWSLSTKNLYYLPTITKN